MGLAPMDGVTDAAFRFMVSKYGKPNVLFTEFVPTDGICAGAEKILDAFIYSENERPIVAQIFGSKPENFYKVAPLLCELGFDGVDINMGCPDKAIVKSGGGASLIGRPEDAKAVVVALKKGIADWTNGKDIETFGLPKNIVEKIKDRSSKVKGQMSIVIPISVKTRIGTNKNTIKEWAECLAEMQLDCVTIHGRTLSQMYHGEADWEAISSGAEIIKKSGTIVLGNGDIKNIKEGKEKTKKYGTDGFLIGRAAMGAPWIFSGKEPRLKEKLRIAIEHAKYYEKIHPETFVNMRKHLAWYCRGFKDASEVRMRLMKANNSQECENVISEIIARNPVS